MFRAAPLFTAVAVAVRSRSRCYMFHSRQSTEAPAENRRIKRSIRGGL